MDSNRDHLVKFMAAQFLHHPCVFAEIGVWTAAFSTRVLKEVDVREAHLIDPWIYSKKLVATSLPVVPYCLNVLFDRASSQAHLDEIYAAVVSLFNADDRVMIHRLTSAEAVTCFLDEYFDWVYIDGDHSQAAIAYDLQVWSAKIKHGGFISGDDYEWGKDMGSPVRKAVDAFILTSGKEMKLLSKDHGQWLIQKT